MTGSDRDGEAGQLAAGQPHQRGDADLLGKVFGGAGKEESDSGHGSPPCQSDVQTHGLTRPPPCVWLHYDLAPSTPVRR